MTPTEITKLDPEQAEEVRKKGFAGDLAAVKDYLLYALWRDIRGRRNFSARAKVKAFSAMASEVSVQWQTTSS